MKNRFVALTDIRFDPKKHAEIDDMESMVRLLLYANEIDIEGLIATTSVCFTEGGRETQRQIILRIIDAYEEVLPNLKIHADGWPEPDSLRKVTFCGVPAYGKKLGQGFGEEQYNDLPAVRHILSILDKDDPRPVWFGLWGGGNTLAQAVWTAWKTRSQTNFENLLSKIRVYGISDQDNGGRWLRQTFGDKLFYIVSPSAGSALGMGAYASATWAGFCQDYMMLKNHKHPASYRGANTALVSPPWLQEHICGNTPYRKNYYLPTFAMEGDTPSFLGLIPTGLTDMEHPNWGGWAGRYEFYQPKKAPLFAGRERFPLWTDTQDTLTLEDGTTVTSNHATIWRWREAVQYDFRARMAWTDTANYADAQHPPVVKLENARLTVKRGQNVSLSVAGSESTDGSALTFHWFHYPEAGTCKTAVAVYHADSAEASFTAPDEKGTLHLIVEVSNTCACPVTRYGRVIVEVE